MYNEPNRRLPSDWVADGIVSRETADRLTAYVELLRRWTMRINLISSGDLDVVWTRHIEDCLQLAPHADASHAIDIGSGAGLPGLVLAIARSMPMVLIEADQRKASFLREAARVTQSDIIVMSERIENARPAPAPLVTARALAALPRLLAWSERLLAPGGRCLFLKGAKADDELTDARREWQMTVLQIPSRVHPDGVLLQLTDIRRVRTSAPSPTG